MASPFKLPSTHALSFSKHYTSPVYPSLPLLCTQHHARFHQALKTYHRANRAQQHLHLPPLLDAITNYLPHLSFLHACLHAGDILPVSSTTHLTPRWSTPLSLSPLPASHPGLEFELTYTLLTLALTNIHLAAASLPANLKPASNHLLTAAAILQHAASLPQPPTATWPVDITPPVLTAIAKLALADATLLFVATQDPYPNFLLVDTPSDDRAWAYNPRATPTGVKAGLLARVCVAAETHAEAARALLKSAPHVSRGLKQYAKTLGRVGRAKACRFLGINAEVAGGCGEGIGWVLLGMQGLRAGAGEGTEEMRVCKGLEERWKAENDRVFFQEVVGPGELVGRVPTGREVCEVPVWECPQLEEAVVRGLRGSVLGGEREEEVETSEEEEEEGTNAGGEGRRRAYF